jgi:hypothetical protein
MYLSKQQSLLSSRSFVRWIRPNHFYFILAIFLLEAVINAQLGINLAVPIVLALIMMLSSRTLISKNLPIGTVNGIVIIVLVLIYQFPSTLAAPDSCTIDSKFLATILTLIFSVWAMWWLRPEQSIFSVVGSKLLMLAILGSVILAQIGLDIFTTFLGSEPRIRSGFYSEPSHLALHLIPLVAYRLLNNFSDRLTWVTLTLVFIFAPSTTLAAGLLGVVVMILNIKIRRKSVMVTVLFLMVGAIGVLVNIMNNNPIIDRLIGIINFNQGVIINLSSSVWLNGWSQAFDHLIASSGWGVGLNQMGCGYLKTAGYLSPLIMGDLDLLLNSTDGSFLFAKIVAEVGLLGLFFCIYLTYLAISSMLAINRDEVPDRNAAFIQHDMICRSAAGLTIIIFLYVRGMSYFAFPSMLAIALLLRPRVRA